MPASSPFPDAPLTVVYIASSPHSGSTLLEMMLDRSPRLVGVGEIKSLYPKRPLDPRKGLRPHGCRCASRDPLACPTWAAVDRCLRADHGLALPDLDLMSRDPEVFERHNLAVLRAVAHVSGRLWIVDGSKRTDRLRGLLALARRGVLDVRPIHLVREPGGVVFTDVRRGRGWRIAARRYVGHAITSRALLRDIDHFRLRYERLASAPRESLEALMTWLGLPFDERQLDWADGVRHPIGGNAQVRASRRSAIALDEGWRRGLALHQRIAITIATLRARIHLTH